MGCAPSGGRLHRIHEFCLVAGRIWDKDKVYVRHETPGAGSISPSTSILSLPGVLKHSQ